jgi:uncharacterized peroxidase-related enzyme
MAWIKEIEEQGAGAPLRAVYEAIKGKRGKISNIMKVQSLNPRAMQAHLDLYLAVMFGPAGLKREERELIAVVVSAANGCEYCVSHHAEALNFYWQDRDKVARLRANAESAQLPDRLRKVIGYALKLTRTPDAMSEADVEALREAGLSDEEILHVNLIGSYFNFVNRIALGLGVTSSQEEVGGYRY